MVIFIVLKNLPEIFDMLLQLAMDELRANCLNKIHFKRNANSSGRRVFCGESFYFDKISIVIIYITHFNWFLLKQMFVHAVKQESVFAYFI